MYCLYREQEFIPDGKYVIFVNIIHWKCATLLNQISSKFVYISCKNHGDGHDDDKVTKEKETSKLDRKRKAVNMKDKLSAIKGGGIKGKGNS